MNLRQPQISQPHVPQRRFPQRRGTVIVIVVILLLVTSLLAASIVRTLLRDGRQLRFDHQAMQAERLAESGLRKAFTHVANDKSTPPVDHSETWNVDLPSGPAVVRIDIKHLESGVTITSQAQYPANATHFARATRTWTSPPEISSATPNQ